tara:strand:+ start:110320 stop:110652 length:333 start_codon:yes stop_codon:yes gene_type:complete
MTKWNKQPTDEELKVIEKEMKSVNLEDEFEVKSKGVQLTEEEIEKKVKLLTKKELEMIDEMVRIIEDKNYISPVRKKRIEEQEDFEVDSVSFDSVSMEGYGYYIGEDSDY